MNRKERRAAKFKAPKPALRDLVNSLCLAAPWCIRTRWTTERAHSLEMSFAGREVLRRYQYAADMASCVLVIGNGEMTLCVGDSRAGYDLLARRGGLGKLPPPYEQWRGSMLFAGDAEGLHTILRAHGNGTRAFADLTFGQVGIKTRGMINVPPAFVGFGNVDWPSATIGDVSFAYTEAPEPPDMRNVTAYEWSGLIDDLATLVEIALGCGNDEDRFAAEMQRQVQQLGR